MISGLKLMDKYKIGIDKNNKIHLDDMDLSIKDIPFVRYHFDKYEKDELDYISINQQRFIYSVHLAEIDLSENSKEYIVNISKLDNVAMFLYVNIEDKDVFNGLDNGQLMLLESLRGVYIDRIMIRDNSTTLNLISINNIKKQIANTLRIDNIHDIGVCGSPFSFQDEACLTAIWARKLAASYCKNYKNAPLPSANHESCCGCVRYRVIDSDIQEPLTSIKKSKNKGETKSNINKKTSSKVMPAFKL